LKECSVIAFEVNDMTCGHCASTIATALKAVDADATIDVDLAKRRVRIEPRTADARTLARAIAEAGYTPVLHAGGADGAPLAAAPASAADVPNGESGK